MSAEHVLGAIQHITTTTRRTPLSALEFTLLSAIETLAQEIIDLKAKQADWAPLLEKERTHEHPDLQASGQVA